MADTATSRGRLRKQTLASNVNIWGDPYLNTNFDLLDQQIDGVTTIALGTSTGTTLTSTNYAVDQQRNKAIVFTGTGTQTCTATVPQVEQVKLVVNRSAGPVVIAPAAGTSVTVAAGERAWIICDGTNFDRGDPTLDKVRAPTAAVNLNSQRITSLADPSALQDAATKNYVDQSMTAGAAAATFLTLSTSSILQNERVLSPASGELYLSTGTAGGTAVIGLSTDTLALGTRVVTGGTLTGTMSGATVTDHLKLVNTAVVNRVAIGTAAAGGTASITLTPGAGGQYFGTDSYFNGMTVSITGGAGAGQSRTISAYNGTSKVATVGTAWSTAPDNTSIYSVFDDRASAPSPGKRWRAYVSQWYEDEGRGGGGMLVIDYDRSVAGDGSDLVRMIEIPPRGLPGQNQNDSKIRLYSQLLEIISDNTLLNGTALDVGPQLSLGRRVNNPAAASQVGMLMFGGRNSAGVDVRYLDIIGRVASGTAGSEAGEMTFYFPQGGATPTLGGGPTSEKGIGWWVQSASGYAVATGSYGAADNKGAGTINALGLYDQGRRVVVTTSTNPVVINGTAATTLDAPSSGTLVTQAGTATLTNKTLTAPVIATIVNTGTLTLPSSTDTLVGRATTDTLTNKTLSSPVLTGTMTGGTISGATLASATTSGNLTIGDTSGAAAAFSGGDGNFYFQLTTTGVIIFRTANGGATQMRVVHTASANRTVDVAGSNGGNPSIGASAGALAFSSIVTKKSYTVATLPSVVTAGEIYVSDESGGAVPAFSDGTNWRRVTDRAIVS